MCACSLVVLVLVVIPVLVFSRAAQRSRPPQVNVPVEGFQLDAGAARSQREGEAPLGGVRDAHRKVRLEVAVERGDRYGGVGPLRDTDFDVAVVGRETVMAAVL